jgi:hypothetical protein
MAEKTFRVTWPGNGSGKDEIDFGRFISARLVRDWTGADAFELPAPFDDLVIANGEALTEDKAARLREAAVYFGAMVMSK